MCGRYNLLRPWSELVALYRITVDPKPLNLAARYNVAPTQDVPIVRRVGDAGERELAMARWGLVPFWAKDIKIGYKTINARAETVHKLPAFRAAFRRRRCLVAADGFYEWHALSKSEKQPYHITLPDRRPFAFAGLWETWQSPDGTPMQSCTIIVTEANDFLRPLHNRMPVILEPEHFDDWLDIGRPLEETQRLFAPFSGDLTAWAVGRVVNSVRNDGPACIEPTSPAVTSREPIALPFSLS
ncbi:MAG: SOS response-associated peptidase [Rhodospirillales bacterium]|nr:SOS response-associated peptidase [Rhodospirillales bacterium]